MNEWSDYEYLLKYHPEVFGHKVSRAGKVNFRLVLKALFRSNLDNLYSLCWWEGKMKKRDVLVFAASLNQHHSLTSAVSALGSRCYYVQAAHYEVFDTNPAVFCLESNFCLSPTDWIRSMIRSIVLFPHILSESRRYQGEVQNKYVRYLFRNCGRWFWLRGILNKCPADWVLTANDHNSENLMLYALARKLGARTAYVQHAHVSNLFPPLCFDVAFLDGECSRDIYHQIARSHAQDEKECHICLTGQQKKAIASEKNDDLSVVGLALNPHVDLRALETLICQMLKEGFEVCLRPHPRESKERREHYSSLASKNLAVHMDRTVGGAQAFFSEVDILLAGDSSVLLEAALAGKSAVYVRLLGIHDAPDYYGFVKNGICLELDEFKAIRPQLDGWSKSKWSTEYDKNLQRYSASFGTKWMSKEGEWLVKQWEELGLAKD